MVADRYRRRDLVATLEKSGFPAAIVVERGMGYRDGSEDVRAWRRALMERRVKVAPSLLLRSAMQEAMVQTNPAGDAKIAKSSQGGRRVRARDDAACAAVIAVGHGSRMPKARPLWVYRGAA